MNYEDEYPRARSSASSNDAGVAPSYIVALMVWFIPPLVAGVLMLALNLRMYQNFTSINPEGEEFLKAENQTACGWPYVMATRDPQTRNWVLNGFGVTIDGIIVLAAACIVGAAFRFVAAFVDYDVNLPIQRQVHQLFRRRPKPTRTRPRSAGPVRRRRPNRPPVD